MEPNLKNRLSLLKTKLDFEGKKRRSAELEKESANPALWQDQRKAQGLMREMAEINSEIERLEKLEKDIGLEADPKEIESELGELELKTFLAGKYDSGDAILSIHAGQGGTEAMDWAQILERMYIKYFEKKGWQWEVVDQTPGDEAGIKSVTLTVKGKFAYGFLRGEAGVHRLVRQSPFNADKLRQTSFAQVLVLPVIEEEKELEIKDEELEWEFFRASSHGGQNVQKVATAVRLKHKPTGIIVSAQAQRYQEQNRKIALLLLKAKLWALTLARAEEEKKELRGEHKIAGWGNQIRSYVLHPYKQIKDLRTGVISSNPDEILDGNLDTLIEAEIKMI